MNKEIAFLKKNVPETFRKFYKENIGNRERKTRFDFVTEIDKNIEEFLIKKIKSAFPDDHILSEETNSRTVFDGRTWTIDPIDGTINMIHSIKLFGIQLSLYDNGEIVVAYIYFPHFNDEYYAIKDCGCYKNGTLVSVDKNVGLEDAIISFGDYSHSEPKQAERQHLAIGYLYSQIAKIRMFGSAAIDFAMVANGSIASCVVLTKNSWDILPGYLLAKEAGAIMTNTLGEEFKIGDYGLVASANEAIKKLVIDSLNIKQ
jgi:myo-inositol-1(or 4)-monophosphatase